MKHKLWIFSVLNCVVLCSCVKQPAGDSAGGSKAKAHVFKTPIAFKSTLPGLGTTIKYVADRLEPASEGKLKLKLYEPGKLVPTLEILDAVSSGKADAGYSVSGYWTGKLPAAPLFSSVPFGPEAGEYLAWMMYGNGKTLYQQMYDEGGYNVKVLVCGVIAPETSGWFINKVTKAEDFKGLKIRFFGLGGDVLKKMGASTTLLPGGEIFPALQKNVIDASEYSMPAIDEKLGFYKIAKHNYFPGWHQQATVYELLINKDRWNQLSSGQQLLFEMACNDATTNSIAEGEYVQFASMKRMQDKGVELVKWSPEMLAAFEKAWKEVAVELSAKDKFFAKIWQDLSAFRKNYKIWKDHAFLPRK